MSARPRIGEYEGDNGKAEDGEGRADRNAEYAPEGEHIETVRHAANRHQRVKKRNALYDRGDGERDDQRMHAQQQYQRTVDDADR